MCVSGRCESLIITITLRWNSFFPQGICSTTHTRISYNSRNILYSCFPMLMCKMPFHIVMFNQASTVVARTEHLHRLVAVYSTVIYFPLYTLTSRLQAHLYVCPNVLMCSSKCIELHYCGFEQHIITTPTCSNGMPHTFRTSMQHFWFKFVAVPNPLKAILAEFGCLACSVVCTSIKGH